MLHRTRSPSSRLRETPARHLGTEALRPHDRTDGEHSAEQPCRLQCLRVHHTCQFSPRSGRASLTGQLPHQASMALQDAKQMSRCVPASACRKTQRESKHSSFSTACHMTETSNF
eukprot:768514-Pleurochrysis_carterae.AAC.4